MCGNGSAPVLRGSRVIIGRAGHTPTVRVEATPELVAHVAFMVEALGHHTTTAQVKCTRGIWSSGHLVKFSRQAPPVE